MTTRSPRPERRLPREAAVRPLPREETTPPVTKMCFVTGIKSFWTSSSTGLNCNRFSLHPATTHRMTLQHFSCMLPGALGVLVTTEHSGNFRLSLFAFEQSNAGAGVFAGLVFHHLQVVVLWWARPSVCEAQQPASPAPSRVSWGPCSAAETMHVCLVAPHDESSGKSRPWNSHKTDRTTMKRNSTSGRQLCSCTIYKAMVVPMPCGVADLVRELSPLCTRVRAVQPCRMKG